LQLPNTLLLLFNVPALLVKFASCALAVGAVLLISQRIVAATQHSSAAVQRAHATRQVCKLCVNRERCFIISQRIVATTQHSSLAVQRAHATRQVRKLCASRGRSFINFTTYHCNFPTLLCSCLTCARYSSSSQAVR